MKYAYIMLFFFVSVTNASAQCGIASNYGTENGTKTSSGEHYNPGGLSAAHRTLPFGTRVHVTNQHNHRSVVVRINDRGPFVMGRIIDLSIAAAKAIGLGGTGYVCF